MFPQTINIAHSERRGTVWTAVYVLNSFQTQHVTLWPVLFNMGPHTTSQSLQLISLWLKLGPSHWLPPLAKHIVDELGHRLGAAVASSVGSVLEVLHHLPDELGEEIGDVLVALGCWDLLEVTAVLLSQAAALILTHLPGVTQVLLVAHQAHRNLRVPETDAEDRETYINIYNICICNLHT